MTLVIRVVGFFLTHRGGGILSVIVTGEQNGLIPEFGQSRQAFIHLGGVASGKVAAAAGINEKRIA